MKAEALPWCHECIQFVEITAGGLDDPFEAGLDEEFADRLITGYHPCARGHALSFEAPRSMGAVNSGDYGFYRAGCIDFAREPKLDLVGLLATPPSIERDVVAVRRRRKSTPPGKTE